jgi:hypothetical protein
LTRPHGRKGKYVMPKVVQAHHDYSDLMEGMSSSRVYGGYVTPGSGETVAVTPIVGTVAGTDVESAGATALSTPSDSTTGHTTRYAVTVDTSGSIAATAGASAVSGSQTTPAITSSQTILATVDAPYSSSQTTQAAINNTVRNWL